MIPRRRGEGKAHFSRALAANSARRPARQERRKATSGRLQPARQVVFEPLESQPRLQHLMGDSPLRRTVVLPGREPGGLNRKAAVGT
jgi:hypothetical protein